MTVDNIDVTDLVGTNGFTIVGAAVQDFLGNAIAIGPDVNGDGIDDLIVGARFNDYGGSTRGSAYVIYGSAGGFAPTINAGSLGASGTSLHNGVAGGGAGNTVAMLGDVNGDGHDDMLITSYGDGHPAYVVFGSATGLPAGIDLASLDGSDGFVLTAAGEGRFGHGGSAVGDVNGDGFKDFAIGADTSDHGATNTGSAFIVFGHNGTFDATVDVASLDGHNGFRIDGSLIADQLGFRVGAAGDLNKDGFADVALDSPSYDTAYVVFGSGDDFAPSFNTAALDGTNGFVMTGDASVGYGNLASPGDLNGDGFDDLVVAGNGKAYVLFSRGGTFAASVDLSTLDGSDGFAITIGAPGTVSVSGAGDVNGDGLADIIVGVTGAIGSGGAAYVVYGRGAGGFGVSVAVTALDSTTGFKITGNGGQMGFPVAGGGDINGDGFDDVLISASANNPTYEGQTYVVFGHASPAVANDDAFTTNESSTAGSGKSLFLNNGSGSDFGTGLTIAEVNGLAGNVGHQITLASGALVTVNADGTFSYDPNHAFDTLGAGHNDSDSFSYTVNGGDTATVTLNIDGLDSNDIITGTRADDNFDGGIGDDVITGGDGNDTLTGGVGNDRLDGGKGHDQIFGNTGDDIISMGNRFRASDSIDGGTGNDTLKLSGDYSFGLHLVASSLVNVESIVLKGGSVYDLHFDDGNVGAGDTLRVTVNGAGGSALLDGSRESDGAFIFNGGTGGDNLIGGAQADLLRGGNGDDSLTGGGGADTLFGGIGSDTFVYRNVGDSSGATTDSIRDFDASTDHIDVWFAFKGMDAEQSAASLADLGTVFDANHLHNHHAALADVGAHTYLVIDANGVAGYQSGADLLIRVDGMVGTLDASNLV